MDLLNYVRNKYTSKTRSKHPAFRSGDVVAVHVRIKEGDKTRVQVFEGTCIAQRRSDQVEGSFTVRKISAGGIGVEKVFPYHSPHIAKIELKTKSKTRRAKHFYLRQRSGKSARLAVDYQR